MTHTPTRAARIPSSHVHVVVAPHPHVGFGGAGTRAHVNCFFGSHTSVPIIWMCKKQTPVSHSSTESEIFSLDAGLKLDGIPALDFWDLIVAVLGNTNQTQQEVGDLLMNKREVRSPPHTIQKRKQSHRVIDDLDNVDFIPSNIKSSHQEALLFVLEDNEAMIKMILKVRSPTMRNVSQNPQSCS